MHIGNAIRLIRKELNISQYNLSMDCGLSQTSLSQIEKGIKRPSRETMRKICTVTEVPETLIYIIAIQEKDVPKSKRHVYRIIHPSLVSLALQMINSAAEYSEEKSLQIFSS